MEQRPIVVVSGASAGIGRATARRFGRDGWRVAVLAQGTDGLDSRQAALALLSTIGTIAYAG